MAYEYSNILVFSSYVRLEALYDFAVCRLCDVENISPTKKDDTVLILNDTRYLNISFETWLERGYVVADGIHAKLVSTKKLGDIDVFTVKKDFLTDTESYVVKRGDTFSHGETIEKAIEDLRYKLSSRDTSRFKNWKLDTEISVDDAIQSYRAITGACEFGVKDFVSKVKIPKVITVGKVIEMTADKFGNREFTEFFKS